MSEFVTIYTDGSCLGNPGPGGWGALLQWKENRRELFGGEAASTNNRMELTAVISALNTLKRPCNVELFTDSEYVRRGICEWMPQWRIRGWRTAAKKPVKNADLWVALIEAENRHYVRWHWVRAHDGNPGNEAADMLARRGMEIAAEKNSAAESHSESANSDKEQKNEADIS